MKLSTGDHIIVLPKTYWDIILGILNEKYIDLEIEGIPNKDELYTIINEVGFQLKEKEIK